MTDQNQEHFREVRKSLNSILQFFEDEFESIDYYPLNDVFVIGLAHLAKDAVNMLDEHLENIENDSGDSARPSALSSINCSSVPGENRDDSMRAEQGGNQCRAVLDSDFVSCDCPECAKSVEQQLALFA